MPAGKAQGSDPLYRRSYDNASVLICKILDYSIATASASGQQQLQWLHVLHTSVDDVLRGLRATKVDSSGDTLTFVSGTENGDEEHAASLVGLARSLLCLCDSIKLPNGAPLRLQLSLHTGEVVSGLVGNLNLKYGVYGETISTARYLQRMSGPGVIVASAQSVRTLLDTCGWQQSGTVKLPNNRMLEIFTLIEGFTGHAQHPQGIRIGPDVCYRGEHQERARPRAEVPDAGTSTGISLLRSRRRRDVAVLGLIVLLALLGAVCLAVQDRIEGLSRSQHWAVSHAPGAAREFKAIQIIATVVMWAGPLCFACLAPLHLYAYARDSMITVVRCLLLVRAVSAVAVATPGAMARVVSALLEPYRELSLIPWAALDFLAGPAAASSLQWDLGLPVVMLLLSTVLPVGFRAHLWSGCAMICTLLAQELVSSITSTAPDHAGFPSTDIFAGLLVLGIGLPALLQTFSELP